MCCIAATSTATNVNVEICDLVPIVFMDILLKLGNISYKLFAVIFVNTLNMIYYVMFYECIIETNLNFYIAFQSFDIVKSTMDNICYPDKNYEKL